MIPSRALRADPVLVRTLFTALASLTFLSPPDLAAAPAAPAQVYRDRVEPRWFGQPPAFWYRVGIRDGGYEFNVVRTEPATRHPAFHHSRLASLLEHATSKPMDAARLPVDSLEFSTNSASVVLRGELGAWRLDLESYHLESLESGAADAADMLEAESDPRPSRRTGAESAITFENRLSRPIELFWISPEGQRVSYGPLAPGASRRQHTFAGHVWLAADQGRPVAVFEAAARPRRALVTDSPRPSRRREDGAGSAATSVLSPDGTRAAFVRDHNLWLRHLASNREVPLSFDGSPGHSFRQDVQRDRLVGMDFDKAEPPASLPEVFWSPDGRYLVALQTRSVPERRVEIVESSPRDQLQPRLTSYPYLKAGDEIPTQRPRLFRAETAGEITFAADLFPTPWSVGEFRWDRGNSRFTFLYNQRGHQVLRLLAVEWEGAETQQATVRTLTEETSATFVDYSNKTYLRFLDGASQFLWMSERSGWNHLLLCDARTGSLLHPVTQGEWVVRRVEHVDETNRVALLQVMGVRPEEDPYHGHLARVNLDGSGFTLLTAGDGSHAVQWSPDRRYFLDTWSRVDHPPVIELRRADNGERLCLVEEADASEVLARRGRFPERFVAPGRDGSTPIHGILHRPADFDPGKRYPVIENIYAGPHDQHVPKSFRGTYRHQQELADRGFIVVQIDGMGTNWRSRKFHDVAARNLGDAGFPDRIAWLKAAAARFPELDLTRVGIYGGSAGGQNALRALLAHGDFYRAGVADCGCHDNRMDKIWWNEAWMGWPVGPHYAEQSNVTQAHRLTGHLMLVVGELDRNVDPASTTQVVNALVKADKDFDFVLIPGAGHGAAESDYGRRRRADFFQKHLQ